MTAPHVMDLVRGKQVATLRKLESAARRAEARKETETRSQALAALFSKQVRSDRLRRCARLSGLPEAQFVAGVRSMAERRAAGKLLARKRAVDSPFFVRDEVSRT